MAEIAYTKISELDEAASTPFVDGYVPISSDVTEKLALAQLRDDILNDATLSGEPTAPTPNPGDDSTRVATTAYVQEELSELGLNPATATHYGPVRTNSTVPAPVLYLKSEVDALVAATKPVNQGGTGATTASDARTNLGAAASGSNNDITALTSLVSVPSVVSTAIATASTIAAPSGCLQMWAGASGSVPSGWLYCNGQAVSRATYAALFTAIGTTYGTGDGSTTFNLPNLLGRVPLGAGVSEQSGTNRSLGTTAGTDTHTLTIAQLPAHSHDTPANRTAFLRTTNTTGSFTVTTAAGSQDTFVALGHAAPTGSGAAHPIMQPFIALNFIIKT